MTAQHQILILAQGLVLIQPSCLVRFQPQRFPRQFQFILNPVARRYTAAKWTRIFLLPRSFPCLLYYPLRSAHLVKYRTIALLVAMVRQILTCLPHLYLRSSYLRTTTPYQPRWLRHRLVIFCRQQALGASFAEPRQSRTRGHCTSVALIHGLRKRYSDRFLRRLGMFRALRSFLTKL